MVFSIEYISFQYVPDALILYYICPLLAIEGIDRPRSLTSEQRHPMGAFAGIRGL